MAHMHIRRPRRSHLTWPGVRSSRRARLKTWHGSRHPSACGRPSCTCTCTCICICTYMCTCAWHGMVAGIRQRVLGPYSLWTDLAHTATVPAVQVPLAHTSRPSTPHTHPNRNRRLTSSHPRTHNRAQPRTTTLARTTTHNHARTHTNSSSTAHVSH